MNEAFILMQIERLCSCPVAHLTLTFMNVYMYIWIDVYIHYICIYMYVYADIYTCRFVNLWFKFEENSVSMNQCESLGFDVFNSQNMMVVER